MSDFPKLVPAFTLRMQTSPQLIMGKTFSSSGMAVGPIEHGTLKSVEGYGAEPFVGEVLNGADVFYVDSLFRAVKLDFRAVIKPSDGEAIFFTFQGIIKGNEETALILRGDPEAKSSNFGSSFMSATFETGNLKWQAMTNKIYVGSQRLIVEPKKPLIVEINLSEVV